MKNILIRITIFLRKVINSVYEFLKQNGFFEEMVRGMVNLIFYFIMFYCFKQVM